MALLAGSLAAASACSAQQAFLDVGTEAPDITLTGASRDGVMAEPLRLSDLRGQTVVLAFFFRARTPG
jgi:peroxiredoxin Q/BCP